MTIKKVFSIVAAAATLTAASASMVSLSADAETGNPVLGKASFIGMIGAESCWSADEVNALSTAADVNGDAQYEVVWNVSETGGTDTIQFLAVSISPVDGVDNFGTSTFPNLTVTIDEVWIDNVKIENYTVSDAAITTSYFDESEIGTTRMYLRDEWAGTGVEDLAGNTVISDNIRVKFTVAGLGVEGDSNVTADPEPPAYTLGDVNEDALIDAVDASLVLAEYAKAQTGKPATFSAAQRSAADVNTDNIIDAVDASKILAYYAAAQTGKTPSWD